jgi:hypothetical protein
MSMASSASSPDASHSDAPDASAANAPSDPKASSTPEDNGTAAPGPDAASSDEHVSEVTVGIHFATNRHGQLHARLLRTQDGNDETDLTALMDNFPAEDVVVRGRIETRLNLNALFAEGLFADRSLDERKLDRQSVESVDHLQREDATPLRNGEPIDTDSTYDLTPDDGERRPPDAVRVAIPFMTDHSGAVCARLNLDETLQDTTSIDAFENVFAAGKALVRGKVRAEVNLKALFDARIVDGEVDPGTMYMPPSS